MKNSEKSILLVDDVPSNIQLLGSTLRSEGYAISFAVNGIQAVELAKKSAFDLILLDIMMPALDGFEVFQILKQQSAKRAVPVIFLSAKTDNESILKAFSLGAVDYILKPFRSSEVLARVRTQLELADSKAVLVEMNQKLIDEIALRKHNEQKLKESESIYKRLVESVPAIVYSLSEKSGTTFISPKVKEILGYSVADFHKNPFLWGESLHPEDHQRYHNELLNSFSGHHHDMKYRIKGASGEFHWLLDRSFGMHIHSDSGMQCIEGLAIDITEQERMEQELVKLVKMESAGIFAGGIAHDMNNLNCVVSGNIELAKEDLRDGDPAHRLLDDAFEAVEKQTRLINQLSTLTEGFKPQKTIGHIDLLIHETVLNLKKKLQSTVELSIAEGLWAINFDKTMIKSVLENIIVNADEAMPVAGNIKVDVKNSRDIQENRELHIAGNYVVISICDNGVGISDNELNLIFDPYYSKKNRGTQKGMGLGLTMSLAIIQKHGGYIFVNSTVGKGSIFNIYLPSAS